jgi:hypothetical protein
VSPETLTARIPLPRQSDASARVAQITRVFEGVAFVGRGFRVHWLSSTRGSAVSPRMLTLVPPLVISIRIVEPLVAQESAPLLLLESKPLTLLRCPLANRRQVKRIWSRIVDDFLALSFGDH